MRFCLFPICTAVESPEDCDLGRLSDLLLGEVHTPFVEVLVQSVSALLKLYVTCYYNFHLWSCPPSHRVCMYPDWCSVNTTVMKEFNISHYTCNCCVQHGQQFMKKKKKKDFTCFCCSFCLTGPYLLLSSRPGVRQHRHVEIQ